MATMAQGNLEPDRQGKNGRAHGDQRLQDLSITTQYWRAGAACLRHAHSTSGNEEGFEVASPLLCLHGKPGPQKETRKSHIEKSPPTTHKKNEMLFVRGFSSSIVIKA